MFALRMFHTLLMVCLLTVITLAGMADAKPVTSHSLPLYDVQENARDTAYHELHQATELIGAHHCTEAIPHLEAAVEKSPTNLMALFNLGACHYDLAREAKNRTEFDAHLVQAENAFVRVQSLNADLLMTYFRLGKIALTRNDFEQAEHYYRAALEIAPDNAVLHFNLAGVYDEQKRYDEAIAHYKRSIELSPDFVFAYNNLGLVYEILKDTNQAEKVYKAALKKNRSYNFARLNLGNLYAEQGKYRTARKLYEEALQYEPENAWAHLYLGNVYFQTDDLENASREYQASIERNPGYATAYYLQAVTLHRLQRYDESLIAGLKYMSLAPQGRYSQEIMALIIGIKMKHAGVSEPILNKEK